MLPANPAENDGRQGSQGQALLHFLAAAVYMGVASKTHPKPHDIADSDHRP
jgi:hypothetical protein